MGGACTAAEQAVPIDEVRPANTIKQSIQASDKVNHGTSSQGMGAWRAMGAPEMAMTAGDETGFRQGEGQAWVVQGEAGVM